MSGIIRPEVLALVERGSVTLEEWNAFRGNSYEFEALYPVLTDEALAHVVRHVVDNCYEDRQRPAITYNAALAHVFVPELLRRLLKATNTRGAEALDATLAAYGASGLGYAREQAAGAAGVMGERP